MVERKKKFCSIMYGALLIKKKEEDNKEGDNGAGKILMIGWKRREEEALLHRHRHRPAGESCRSSRHPQGEVAGEPRSRQSAGSRNGGSSCQRPKWPGTVEDGGILPGRPSSGCRTCPAGRCR